MIHEPHEASAMLPISAANLKAIKSAILLLGANDLAVIIEQYANGQSPDVVFEQLRRWNLNKIDELKFRLVKGG